ncbi:MAG: c-type cytochrome [Kofleriaceae bacterium]
MVSVALAACSSKPEPPPAPAPGPAPAPPRPVVMAGSMSAAPPATPAAEARRIFDSRCAMCHGTSGRGDGNAAMSMNPKPRDYTDATWQASVTDADLARIIVAGGAAVGKNSMMPPSADLQDKPAVVTALVAIIRGFGGSPAAP